jgi:transcriptional regulator NrdR family protein
MECPYCGCVKLPVIYTRHRKGKTIRRRDCTCCGERLMTQETLMEKGKKHERNQTDLRPWWTSKSP